MTIEHLVLFRGGILEDKVAGRCATASPKTLRSAEVQGLFLGSTWGCLHGALGWYQSCVHGLGFAVSLTVRV